jgi:glucose-6-phosphate isomerase
MDIFANRNAIAKINIKEEFAKDAKRFSKFSLSAAGLLLDYSKNKINAKIMAELFALAKSSKLREHIESMFNGEKINITEDRAVLHTALRNPNYSEKILVDGKNVMPDIENALRAIEHCAESIRNGSWKGHTHKRITDIVNIGIGGSDLGPHMVVEALRPYSLDTISYHFV